MHYRVNGTEMPCPTARKAKLASDRKAVEFQPSWTLSFNCILPYHCDIRILLLYIKKNM